MDTLLFFSPTFLAIVIVLAILLKFGLFIKFRTRNWKAINFIYFAPDHIILSESNKRADIKKLQNGLTFLTAIVIFFEILILFVSRGHA